MQRQRARRVRSATAGRKGGRKGRVDQAQRANLHAVFVDALGDLVETHSELRKKPLDVDLKHPLPRRVRLYMYSLVGGTLTTRPNEYKASLRVPGQRVGQYGSFDHSDGRLVLLVGYRPDLDVFVIWDASLHPRFKNGGNIQVRSDTVVTAAALGEHEQLRRLTHNAELVEVVLACTSAHLASAINRRLDHIGGLEAREVPP